MRSLNTKLRLVLMMALLWTVGTSEIFAQHEQLETRKKMVVITKTKTASGKMLENKIEKWDDEVDQFDVSEVLENWDGQSNIIVSGYVKKGANTDRYYFNTYNLKKDELEYDHFCEYLKEETEKAFLGVTSISNDDFSGIIIESIIDGTPAANAGFQTGDIITSVESASISTSCELTTSLSDYSPGDQVAIHFLRDGKMMTAYVTLAVRYIRSYSWEPCEKPVVSPIASNEAQLQIQDLKVFPNPGEGLFQLSFNSDATSSLSISIDDASGRNLYAEKVNNFDTFYLNQIDLRREANGVYFLTIVQDDQIFTDKIVIQKQ